MAMPRSDVWDRTSRDAWYEAAPRYDADAWDETEEREWRAPRKRVGIARAIGVIGVLGTLALAVAAFLPRMPALAGKVNAVTARVALPWDPKLNAGPAAMALDRDSRIVPAVVAFAEPTPASLPVAQAPVTRAPEPTRELEPAWDPDAHPEEAVDTPATEAPKMSETPAMSDPPVRSEALVPSRDAPMTGTSDAASSGRASEAPTSSPAEIQGKKERYEEWLKEQGLERIQ